MYDNSCIFKTLKEFKQKTVHSQTVTQIWKSIIKLLDIRPQKPLKEAEKCLG